MLQALAKHYKYTWALGLNTEPVYNLAFVNFPIK